MAGGLQPWPAMQSLRTILAVSAVAFGLVAFVHTGWLTPDWTDPAARLAEGLIAADLVVCLVITYRWPRTARPVALVGQVLALLFTMLGATITLLVGGPRMVIEVGYHLVLIGLLVVGIVIAWRMPATSGADAVRS